LIYIRLFYALFYFNASYQFVPLLNSPTFIFDVTPFSYLRSIMQTPYFGWEYQFCFTPM